MRPDRGFARSSAPVTLLVDGQPIRANSGIMLAAALLAAGIRTLRRSPREGGARGAFCYMGACQECLVTVDGARQQACRVTVRDGMRITLGTIISDETG